MKYYTNQDVARRLGVNLARWKRWSRVFLAPDPLGGLQSGFARQYTLREAFTVALGGHLVGELKYTLPEANQIIVDLKEWLKAHGFLPLSPDALPPAPVQALEVPRYRVYIAPPAAEPNGTGGFRYALRCLSACCIKREGDTQIASETYRDELIGDAPSVQALMDSPKLRMLNLSAFYREFLKRMTTAPPVEGQRG